MEPITCFSFLWLVLLEQRKCLEKSQGNRLFEKCIPNSSQQVACWNWWNVGMCLHVSVTHRPPPCLCPQVAARSHSITKRQLDPLGFAFRTHQAYVPTPGQLMPAAKSYSLVRFGFSHTAAAAQVVLTVKCRWVGTANLQNIAERALDQRSCFGLRRSSGPIFHFSDDGDSWKSLAGNCLFPLRYTCIFGGSNQSFLFEL